MEEKNKNMQKYKQRSKQQLRRRNKRQNKKSNRDNAKSNVTKTSRNKMGGHANCKCAAQVYDNNNNSSNNCECSRTTEKVMSMRLRINTKNFNKETKKNLSVQ